MTTPSSEDLESFRAFEQSGWNTTAAKYDEFFGGVTPVFCEALLDAAGVISDMRVLDIATGPGYVAGAAANRGADAVGIDFAPNMVAEARKLNPKAAFQEGDAEDLHFPDASFDAVVISFGMLHFSRPEAVLAEVLRVLQPGGSIAFTVWGKPQGGAAGLGILLRAIETHGSMDVGLPPGPPLFRFSDHNESRKTLLDAGFVDPLITDLPHTWELSSYDVLIDSFREAGVRAGELLRSQNQEALERIVGFVRDELKSYDREGIIGVPMGAVLASAKKPT